MSETTEESIESIGGRDKRNAEESDQLMAESNAKKIKVLPKIGPKIAKKSLIVLNLKQNVIKTEEMVESVDTNSLQISSDNAIKTDLSVERLSTDGQKSSDSVNVRKPDHQFKTTNKSTTDPMISQSPVCHYFTYNGLRLEQIHFRRTDADQPMDRDSDQPTNSQKSLSDTQRHTLLIDKESDKESNQTSLSSDGNNSNTNEVFEVMDQLSDDKDDNAIIPSNVVKLTKLFKCNVNECEEGFDTELDLKSHYETHVFNEKSGGVDDLSVIQSKLHWDVCPTPGCGRRFKKSYNLRLHQRADHGLDMSYIGANGKHNCFFWGCKSQFSTANALAVHQKSVHNVTAPEIKSVPENYICDTHGCQQLFKTLSALKQHLKDSHSLEFYHKDVHAFQCSANGCMNQFHSRSALEAHKKSTHSGKPSEAVSVPKQYICGNGCKQVFATESLLRSHRDINHKSIFNRRSTRFVDIKPKPIQCLIDGCSEDFITQFGLKLHQTQIHGLTVDNSVEPVVEIRPKPSTLYTIKQRIRCLIDGCTEDFVTELGLKLHQTQVHGLTVCDKSVKQVVTQTVPQTLDQRTDRKPIVCDINDCIEVFDDLNGLERHKSLSHVFRCLTNGCTEVFTSTKLLLKHRKEKHVFVCEKNGCTEWFDTNQEVSIHRQRCHPSTDRSEANKIVTELSLTVPNVMPIQVEYSHKKDDKSMPQKSLIVLNIKQNVIKTAKVIDSEDTHCLQKSTDNDIKLKETDDPFEYLSSYVKKNNDSVNVSESDHKLKTSDESSDNAIELEETDDSFDYLSFDEQNSSDSANKCESDHKFKTSDESTFEPMIRQSPVCKLDQLSDNKDNNAIIPSNVVKLKNLFKCNVNECEEGFDTAMELKKHHKRHVFNEKCRGMNGSTVLQNYVCPTPGCGQRFKTGYYLRVHQRADHGLDMSYIGVNGEHKCGFGGCKYQFSTANALAVHQKSIHNVEAPENKSVPENYICDTHGCEQLFQTLSALKQHQKDSHSLESHQKEKGFHTFQCSANGCMKQFPSRSALVVHKKSTHRGKPSDVLSVPKQYICSINECKQVFATESLLRSHQKINHKSGSLWNSTRFVKIRPKPSTPNTINHRIRCLIDSQAFQCSECQLMLRSKKSLLNHLSYKHKIPSFECDLCDYKTTNTFYLNRHKTSHTSEKPFFCEWDECGRRFKTKAILLTHIRHSHSSIKRFECQLCEYKTSNKGRFDDHQCTHSKDKPFMCEVDGCGKWYKTKVCLYQHNKVVHNRVHLVCDYPDCDRVYSSRIALRQHQFRHKTTEQFVCGINGCQKRFIEKRGLTRHQKYNCALNKQSN